MKCELYKNDLASRERIRDQQMGVGMLKGKERTEYWNNLPGVVFCDGEWHWRAKGMIDLCRLERCCEYLNGIAEFAASTSRGKVQTTETFDEKNGEMKKAIKFLNKNNHYTLLLSGKTGTGKTHIARACVAETIRIGKTAKYIPWVSLKDVFFKQTESERREDAQDEIYKLLNSYLLVIDDFLTREDNKAPVPESAYIREQFQKVLDSMTGKLILTTNIPPEEFPAIVGDRIASRLLEKRLLLPMIGKDHREIA